MLPARATRLWATSPVTPALRQRTPATQPGQWGNQPPHRQTDASDVDVAPDAHPSSRSPGQRLGDTGCALDTTASISAAPGALAVHSPPNRVHEWRGQHAEQRW